MLVHSLDELFSRMIIIVKSLTFWKPGFNIVTVNNIERNNYLCKAAHQKC